MKKLYFLSVILLVQFTVWAQIISFPDVNFKSKLLEATPDNSIAYNSSYQYFKIDANNDGEIQLTEAAAVAGLSIPNANIVSIQGIESFVNLEYLNCENNSINAISISNLPNLNELNCGYNSLTSLDVTASNLQILHCNNNQLTGITNLTASAIHTLDYSYNQLATFELPSSVTLYYLLNISGNLFTSIDLSNLTIYFFSCDNTLLTSLDFSNSVILKETVSITNNSNLQSINFKNGRFDFCYVFLGGCHFYFILSDNPALNYICTDEFLHYGPTTVTELSFFQSQYSLPGVTFNSYCTLTPGGNFNSITGNVKFNSASNICDSSTMASTAVPMVLTTGTTNLGTTFTNSSGNFAAHFTNDNCTLTPQFENPYYTVSPTSFTSGFSATINTQVADFCISPNGIHADSEITLLPITDAVPGFNAKYRLVYKNKGNQELNGLINFTFNDAILDFVSANSTPFTQTMNTLIWNFTGLLPFETRTIDIILAVNVQVNTNDILPFTVHIASSQTDVMPVDNQFAFNQTVVSAFGFNDKIVTEGATISVSETGNYLHYLIRFQNNKSEVTQTLVVKDILADNLDENTLQVISSSHAYRSTLTSEKKVEFFFENIHLPASGVNEPESYGFIAFKIKPKNTVGLGSVIENKAMIYLDNSFPLVTNTTTTTVVALGSNSLELNSLLRLHPNPTHTIFNIDFKESIAVQSIQIYNTLGQIVQTVSNPAAENPILVDVTKLKSGTYFVQIISEKGKANKKLIKL